MRVFVERIIDNSGNAQIVFPDGESYPYRESPEEVARKVLKYRLEKDWHHASIIAGCPGDADRAKKRLMELAGLGGQKDDHL